MCHLRHLHILFIQFQPREAWLTAETSRPNLSPIPSAEGDSSLGAEKLQQPVPHLPGVTAFMDLRVKPEKLLQEQLPAHATSRKATVNANLTGLPLACLNLLRPAASVQNFN